MTEQVPYIDTLISPSTVYLPSFASFTLRCQREVHALMKWSEVAMETHVSIGTLHSSSGRAEIGRFL